MRTILASALWQKYGAMLMAYAAAAMRPVAALAGLAEAAKMGAAKALVVRAAAASVATARRALAGTLVLTATLSSGCSTVDFAWSMGPAALGFMADSYLDLDGEQETLLKERMLATREWIRVTHAAPLGAQFASASTRVAGNVTQEDAAWLTLEGRRRLSLIGARAATEIAAMAPRLTPDNIAALRKKFARNNAEFTTETIDVTPDKQRANRFKRVREQFERWYGDFDDVQLERLKGLSDALPMQPRLVLQDRVRRQTAMLAVLTGLMDKSIPRADGEQRLTVLLTEFERGRSPEFLAVSAAYLAQAQSIMVQVGSFATPAQRDTAQRRLKRWADDLEKLANRKDS